MLQENLSLVQKLYQQIQEKFKTLMVETVQINKKLPYQVVSQVNQLIEIQFMNIADRPKLPPKST